MEALLAHCIFFYFFFSLFRDIKTFSTSGVTSQLVIMNCKNDFLCFSYTGDLVVKVQKRYSIWY